VTGRQRLRAILAGPLAALTIAPLLATASAHADTITDARAQAAALATSVRQLQTRAEVATESYDAAESRLAEAVTRQTLAREQVDADRADVAVAQQVQQARVRALYESGGQTTLLATVLDGTDPADAMARLHVIGNLFTYDSSDVASSAAVVAEAATLAHRLDVAAREVTRLQHAAAIAAGRVRVLLAQQRHELRSANRRVRALVAQQRAALEAADAAAFQTELASAGGILGQQNSTPTNDVAAGAIAAARTRLGDPYVWGATGPDTFDCSGLTQWAYAHVGIQLPRVAADQYNAGSHVALAALQPGDLLFWATDVHDPATIHHVAMYIGAGMMIAAPHTGDVVKIQPVYLSGYIGATRPYSTSEGSSGGTAAA
jgi:cell wall-associated NlpC family hydrolase